LTTPEDFVECVNAVALRRDQDAFTRLFDHFAPRINSYLQRYGADMALAEEITQDVMITLWRKAEQFDSKKSSLSTWLFRIARNRRIDMLRRNRVDYVDPSEPSLVVADDLNIETQFDLQQREDAMREALKSLPPEQLTLVRLSFFENMSHSEISEKTGLPLGTVKSRIRLSFTRLRRALEASGVLEAS
jgi:RNA polymerase sigma factor (sigma-70 family)